MESPQEYYAHAGLITAAGTSAAAVRALPRDIAQLCPLVQGLLIHRDIGPWLYNLRLSKEQRDVANIRPVAAMLSTIRSLDGRDITVAREPSRRMPGVCSHFSTLLVGILREQGTPARARCG